MRLKNSETNFTNGCLQFRPKAEKPDFLTTGERISCMQHIERRRNRRYRAQDGTVALLLGAPLNLMGSVIDVSREGLAFRYIANGKRPSESFELDILYSHDLVYIDKIPFIIVSDTEISGESASKLFPLRRCGVQFGEMTESQKLRLKYLIENHTFLNFNNRRKNFLYARH
jgi:hypothetical protein